MWNGGDGDVGGEKVGNPILMWSCAFCSVVFPPFQLYSTLLYCPAEKLCIYPRASRCINRPGFWPHDYTDTRQRTITLCMYYDSTYSAIYLGSSYWWFGRARYCSLVEYKAFTVSRSGTYLGMRYKNYGVTDAQLFILPCGLKRGYASVKRIGFGNPDPCHLPINTVLSM